MKPTRNLLVVFEELGGDISKVSLVKRSVSSVCADMSEYHPMIDTWHTESHRKSEEPHRPKVHLHCPPGQSISTIKFASFGTPSGTCGSFQKGSCHSPNSQAIVEKVCFYLQPLVSIYEFISLFGSYFTSILLLEVIQYPLSLS